MNKPPLDTEQHVARIAQALGETEKEPIHQIRLIIRNMGPEFADEILREAEAIEAQGGMMLERENRRRTAGGVFFHLVRNRLPRRTRFLIFGLPRVRREQGQRPQHQAQPQPVAPLSMEELPVVLQALTGEYGKASTVKITLIGRPTQVVERGEVVIFGLVNDKSPALPKGLPAPPTQTKYLVLVAKKQWNKVAEAIKAEDDALIIEGYPAYEPRHAGITVYTLTVTTKKLQQAKREAQQAAERDVQVPGAV